MNRALLTLLLLALATGAFGAARLRADDTAPAGAPEGGATVLNAPGDPLEADDLPAFDQAAILADQKDRLDTIRQTLQLQMLESESDNFLLFSDLDSRVRRAILIWLEDLRTTLMTRLGVPEGTRLWDGKCLVVCFARQEDLRTFAAAFDDHHVDRPRGYFVLEARRARGPRLVHVAAYQPGTEDGNRRLREVLVHETTHAIIELYRRAVPLPLWLHEGLAETMTVVADPELRPEKQAAALRLATAEPYQSIQWIFTSRFSSANVAAYSLSMSLVECLMAVDPAGVLRMIDLLKEGVEPEAALSQAYPGLNYAELERRWRRFCMLNYRPPVTESPRR